MKTIDPYLFNVYTKSASTDIYDRLVHYLVKKVLKLSMFLDWIFDIPDLYSDCSDSAAECQAQGAQLTHMFNKFVDATNQVTVLIFHMGE